ncbi:MAG: nitroreductase family protein [Bryobacteraceae bacterium]
MSSGRAAEPPEKAADTLPGVHELIRTRWSPRSFSAREVSGEDLKTLLEAARWAASSYNEQPWRFLVGRKSDPAAYEKILSLLVPANQAWAKTAQVLMIMVAKRTFSHNGSPNLYGIHDAGQALANLFMQATAMGLHAHGMAGFDRERARKELAIPDDYDFGAAIAIGYAGSPDDLPEQYRNSEVAKRTRKPLNEIVFGANWNSPLEL